MKKITLVLFVVLLFNSSFIHSSANAINTFKSRFCQFIPAIYFIGGSLVMGKLIYSDENNELILKIGTCAFLLSNGISYILPTPKGFHCCGAGFCPSCPTVKEKASISSFY